MKTFFDSLLEHFGVVQDFTPSGDVIVEYSDKSWRYNPEALTKVKSNKLHWQPQVHNTKNVEGTKTPLENFGINLSGYQIKSRQ